MQKLLNRIRAPRLFVRVLSFVLLLLIATRPILPQENGTSMHSLAQIRSIADELSGRLGMQQNIQVLIVPHNERMVSVEHISNPGQSFVLSFDRKFLNEL